ncbi:hypothetical protein LUZ63_017595 [Rhynchospora breviuscula]|uniref:Alginate lyase 2 domain-containing protein n=1 Tax=Rhynchospora breviuscula TaxID=2022672 RepID=A0A9Q0HHC8_9POAL|nr:hypothetical protein LUZ63_017595 [Rhynchospora breviuscula]
MIHCKLSSLFLSTTFVLFAVLVTLCKGGSDVTDGFTAVPLNEGNFKLQKPNGVDPSGRYSFKSGVRKLWVYSNDKPFKPDTDTKPRTELRITGYDYSSGVWQFEAYAYIPKGTTGVSIMQIFNGDNRRPTLMLSVYDGRLKFKNKDVIEDNINDKWFRINVVHTFGESIYVYINGRKKYFLPDDQGGGDCYFKFGVYAQEGSSNYMESKWTDVKIYRKSLR